MSTDSTTLVRERSFKLFMPKFRRIRKRRRRRPITIRELQDEFYTLYGKGISHAQAKKYLEEGVRRDLVGVTRVFFLGKRPKRLFRLASEPVWPT